MSDIFAPDRGARDLVPRPRHRGKLVEHAKRTAAIVALTVSVLVVGTAPVQAASTSAPDATPRATKKATEIGVTGTTIRIAAVDDVDNPIVPGVLQGIVDGVNGAARMINAHGGIAGRKLQVDFIDSKLNPNEARNAFITACSQDYAMVGTGALLLGTAQDEIDCKDRAGQATGLPDIAALATSILEACSPVAFPINGSQIDCATVDQHPQRYQGLVGDSKYYLKKFGPLHGTFIVANDSKPTERASTVLNLMAKKAGIEADSEVTRSGGSQQSAYTSIVQQMKNDGSNYNLDATAVDGTIVMRQEAQIQGLGSDSKVLWACPVSCYDKKVVAAGSVMDNTYMTLSFLPFAETKANTMLANFVKYVGKDKVSGFSNWGFTSTLLFKQAVDDVVKAHGVNGLTRANLLGALKAVHSFSAGGMIGDRDAGARLATPCFVIVRYEAGKFSRVYPTKKGTMDCKPSNNAYVEADLLG
jgi:ABC-type branched-subunit amino acid transport system substrate-binding protein